MSNLLSSSLWSQLEITLPPSGEQVLILTGAPLAVATPIQGTRHKNYWTCHWAIKGKT